MGDLGAVTLDEHRDLLLDILDLIFSIFQVNDGDGHHLPGVVIWPCKPPQMSLCQYG